MGDAVDPTFRTCVRCGRSGSNAFRPIPIDAGRMGWLCTHVEPCVTRMRTRHRSGARQLEGRPPTSPIAPAHVSERPACVIGSDAASVGALAEVLAGLAAVEVDRLDLTRRTLDLVSRRDYALVIIDTHPDDPVAFVNELCRRLASARHRESTVIVCRDDAAMRPAVEHLVRRTSARSLLRPYDADRVMSVVRQATHGDLVPAAS